MKITAQQLVASKKQILEVKVKGNKNNLPYTAALVLVNYPFDGQSGMLMGRIIGSLESLSAKPLIPLLK